MTTDTDTFIDHVQNWKFTKATEFADAPFIKLNLDVEQTEVLQALSDVFGNVGWQLACSGLGVIVEAAVDSFLMSLDIELSETSEVVPPVKPEALERPANGA